MISIVFQSIPVANKKIKHFLKIIIILGGSSGSDARPSNSRESMETEKDSSSNCMGYREGTANITDFSPDWAYTEVILLIGNTTQKLL